MKCVCRPYRVLATASLFVLAVALPALAQDASDTDVPVDPSSGINPFGFRGSKDTAPPRVNKKSRAVPVDPYAAPGIRMGAFTVSPTLEMGTAATSNVAGASSGAKADAGLLLRPGLKVESDWSRHQFTASASGEMVRYLKEEDLSTQSADVQTTLRLDVLSGTTVEFQNGYTLTSTGSSSSEVPDTAIGNRLSHLLKSEVALRQEAGITEWRLATGLRREIFEDVALSGGGKEDNGDRNYTELGLSLRGTLNRGAIIKPFVEAGVSPRFHDREFDRSGLRRDSMGYSATLGLRIDNDPLWSGEVGATYQIRDYEDSSLGTVRAPGLLANLKWRPTELTAVDLTATLGISETASASDAATTAWNAGAKVTHALRDNLDLIGGASFSASENSGGTDLTYGVEAGVSWKMNPYLAWALMYDGEWLDSASVGGDSDEHRMLASIILKR